MQTVFQNKKLNLKETLKANMPRPDLYMKYRKEDKDRAKNARRNARLVYLCGK